VIKQLVYTTSKLHDNNFKVEENGGNQDHFGGIKSILHVY